MNIIFEIYHLCIRVLMYLILGTINRIVLNVVLKLLNNNNNKRNRNLLKYSLNIVDKVNIKKK